MPQILLKVPITTDGTTPFISSGRAQYKEVIVEATARSIFEKKNEKLPEHLKVIISDYTPLTVEEEKILETKPNVDVPDFSEAILKKPRK